MIDGQFRCFTLFFQFCFQTLVASLHPQRKRWAASPSTFIFWCLQDAMTWAFHFFVLLICQLLMRIGDCMGDCWCWQSLKTYPWSKRWHDAGVWSIFGEFNSCQLDHWRLVYSFCKNTHIPFIVCIGNRGEFLITLNIDIWSCIYLHTMLNWHMLYGVSKNFVY